jgi:aspartate 1-decarboxylase
MGRDKPFRKRRVAPLQRLLTRKEKAAIGAPSFFEGGGAMQLTLMKGKIHRATVTGADLHYEGSIGIDRALMEAAGFLKNERVEIYNIASGARFATYVIEEPSQSGAITLNGAAARLVQKGDPIIICAYAQMDEAEARQFQPRVVIVDEQNRPKN